MKLLIWLVIAFAIVNWFSRLKNGGNGARRASSQDSPQASPQPSPPPFSRSTVETMVQCSHCDIYIPSSEAIMDTSGNAFCSTEHRTYGSRRN